MSAGFSMCAGPMLAAWLVFLVYFYLLEGIGSVEQVNDVLSLNKLYVLKIHTQKPQTNP